ncbi:DUF4012 domain-containing protein [Williamsia maris]|uniref:DUF4012 domain-containing protein n=1 Tax=Williamsia maris TaxID=72806 RepID=A0ABT1HIT6_9NOCA|nr:DUF4012 domain-containing protein [Williamsia maris]MCP2177839.1 Protein of unknown function (DUF4012) [Williamsia maris]
MRCAIAGLLIMIGFAAWCSVDLITARADLTAARGHLAAAQAAIGNTAVVQREVSEAGSASASARAALGRRPLSLVTNVPWIGAPIDSATAIASVLDDVTHSGLPQAAAAMESLTSRPLLDRGRVDIDAIRRSQAPLAAASGATSSALRRAKLISGRTWLPPVDRARDEFVEQLSRLDSTLSAARTATDLAPSLLGADRRRTFLVGLQNNAEARGTGGLIGGFILFSADRGKISLIRVVKDLALPPRRPIDLGADYENLYGSTDPTRIWQNSNQSPHFPYAARIWRSLARQLTGVTPDVVIGIDPPGLRSILGATGPVALPDGRTAAADTIVATTESEAYARFADDRDERKTYLADIAEATFDRITSGRFQVTALASALGAATRDERIAVWSQAPAEQAELAGTALGHEVPYSPGPYANVVVNNAYASKLDYYLGLTVRYRYGACTDERQQILIDVTLTNNVPDAVLSPEVLGTYLPGGGSLPPRTNRVTLALYSSWSSRIKALTVDGSPVSYGEGVELGHPVHYVVLPLAPRTPTTVRFEVSEPQSTVAPDIPVQPLTNPADVRVLGQPCS